jgi:hypothetical protein
MGSLWSFLPVAERMSRGDVSGRIFTGINSSLLQLALLFSTAATHTMISDQPLMATLRHRQLMKGTVAAVLPALRKSTQRPRLTASPQPAHDLRLLLLH